MGKTLLVLLGVIQLVPAVLLAVCGFKYGKRNGMEFDERQQAERNKGYRVGFWFALGSILGAMIGTVLYCKNRMADPKILVLIFTSAMVIPVMAFYTYCAAKDALVNRWASLKTEGLLLLLVGAGQILSALLDRDIFTGMPEWYRLALGVCFVYLSGTHLFCHLCRGRG